MNGGNAQWKRLHSRMGYALGDDDDDECLVPTVADCALHCQWIYGCTSESWITVDITKRSRETIPHIRTTNRKCTLPELSSCASYGSGSGSWRSEVTFLWVCRVKCYQVSEIGRTWCISVAILNVTWCLTERHLAIHHLFLLIKLR